MFLFMLTTLWISKYHLLIGHTFRDGSNTVDMYASDFAAEKSGAYMSTTGSLHNCAYSLKAKFHYAS